MIQIFKLKELNQVELSHLEELNSWWDKPVDKKNCKMQIVYFKVWTAAKWLHYIW